MTERGRYDPIRLIQTNRYAGYQFHAYVRIDGMTAEEAYHYVVLTIYQWVLKRIPAEDSIASELQVPAPEDYRTVTADAFYPFHLNIGFALDITPFSNLWALRIKETDQGTTDRQAVVGRFFTTRIGVRLDEKDHVELGIKIDVTDPAGAENEVDFAFRPGFVRPLANQPSVHFEQVVDLKYGESVKINTDDEYKRFLFLLNSEENQLPLVVFTYARPEEKKPDTKISMEEFAKSDLAKSLLHSSITSVSRTGLRFPDAPMPVLQEKPKNPTMPYDTDRFSKSAFAYALTYVLGDKYTDRFRNRIKKDFTSGDILLLGAKRFRGEVNIISYPGEKEDARNKAYDRILLMAQSYSKHKSPYSFGWVVFEAEARKLAQQRDFQMILDSEQLEEKERYAKLVQHAEELNAVINGKDEKIVTLQERCDEEFDRGVAFRENEIRKLKDEISSLKKQLTDEQDKNRQMMSNHQWAKDVLSALDQIRKFEKLPSSNEDVIMFFQRAYPDRLGFTARGKAEASKCGLRTDHLWEVLYMVANDLTDLFRSKQGNLTEEEVTGVAGCEMSFREGAQTRKDSDQMKLRDDEYEGKSISVEPHLKIKSWKGEPDHQRLHFCYDAEVKKIIIGYLGDHLDSAATRYKGQR